MAATFTTKIIRGAAALGMYAAAGGVTFASAETSNPATPPAQSTPVERCPSGNVPSSSSVLLTKDDVRQVVREELEKSKAACCVPCQTPRHVARHVAPKVPPKPKEVPPPAPVAAPVAPPPTVILEQPGNFNSPDTPAVPLATPFYLPSGGAAAAAAASSGGGLVLAAPAVAPAPVYLIAPVTPGPVIGPQITVDTPFNQELQFRTTAGNNVANGVGAGAGSNVGNGVASGVASGVGSGVASKLAINNYVSSIAAPSLQQSNFANPSLQQSNFANPSLRQSGSVTAYTAPSFNQSNFANPRTTLVQRFPVRTRQP